MFPPNIRHFWGDGPYPHTSRWGGRGTTDPPNIGKYCNSILYTNLHASTDLTLCLIFVFTVSLSRFYWASIATVHWPTYCGSLDVSKQCTFHGATMTKKIMSKNDTRHSICPCLENNSAQVHQIVYVDGIIRHVSSI